MPSTFLTPLEIEYIDGRSWKILKEFDYFVDYEDLDTTIRVPAGFVTDFASIPRGLWNIFPPTGRYGKAAYTKKDADRIFYEAMEILGVGKIKRWLMWKSVSAFGRGNFGKV